MMFTAMRQMMSNAASASFVGADCASSAMSFILILLGAILLASIIISLLDLAGIILLVLPVLLLKVFAMPLKRQSLA